VAWMPGVLTSLQISFFPNTGEVDLALRRSSHPDKGCGQSASLTPRLGRDDLEIRLKRQDRRTRGASLNSVTASVHPDKVLPSGRVERLGSSSPVAGHTLLRPRPAPRLISAIFSATPASLTQTIYDDIRPRGEQSARWRSGPMEDFVPSCVK
jgi:hypothetical protein